MLFIMFALFVVGSLQECSLPSRMRLISYEAPFSNASFTFINSSYYAYKKSEGKWIARRGNKVEFLNVQLVRSDGRRFCYFKAPFIGCESDDVWYFAGHKLDDFSFFGGIPLTLYNQRLYIGTRCISEVNGTRITSRLVSEDDLPVIPFLIVGILVAVIARCRWMTRNSSAPHSPSVDAGQGISMTELTA